ncbi:hypothetical protein JAAARDRAFT_31591 [Jaapia argillacea MUCL 33604]|uniref:Uncharacterized protein n=1 Tax=Jaapia argillacea MUCL 33604 TaxID=933084 RepID=A0A067Q0M0_9AGAM|nr:hypothetical protein JAAARDRAFT_31591 [Jaapia argillacea MUCL 33604]
MQTADSSNFLRSEAELALEEARKLKAERTKTLGSPIELPGKPLGVEIIGGEAWIAESTAVARVVDLENGKSRRIFRGHGGPVTCLAFCEDQKILITGSWDKAINLWDSQTKDLISSTPAHSDFVKTLLVVPSLKLLISGSSDKSVRFWDLSKPRDGKPLAGLGSISSHTRPVEALEAHPTSSTSAILFTGDTMGIIKVWELTLEGGPSPRWRSTLKTELTHHRTRINEMAYGNGQLWTASADDTIQIIEYPPPATATKPLPPITHPTAVRCFLALSLTELAEPYLITGAGDVIRVYDVSSPDEPDLLNEMDAHWHDVTALRLWVRKTTGDDGKARVEPWIVSASLDGTLRKWRLSEMLTPQAKTPAEKPKPVTPPPAKSGGFAMTEEEERELAELMDED